MDRIKKYQRILELFFIERAAIQDRQKSGLSAHLLINEARTDFLLLKIGWAKKMFVHTVTFHMLIKDQKIWIYENKTDVDVAQLLVENGVAKADIVLGYLSSELRQLSEYGAASSY